MLRIIDKQAKTWGKKEYPMPTNVGNVYPGSGRYLFYYDNGDSLYGYDAEKEAGEKILSWSSADINRSDLAFFTFLEDGRVAAMTRTWGENGMETEIAILTEQDGKLYQIFNSFNIRTAVGATSVVGEEMSWTLENLQSTLATMPEGCAIFSASDTKEYMLNNVMAMQMDNFVDWTTGECYFDSEEFIALLEFCNRFPLTFDWKNYDYEDYESENARIAAGKQMSERPESGLQRGAPVRFTFRGSAAHVFDKDTGRNLEY